MRKQTMLVVIRTAKGISQKELADVLQISRSGYSYKENGVQDFKMSEMLTLANYLGVKISDIFLKKKLTICEKCVKGD